MEDKEYVSYDVAELLKSKNYNKPVYGYYLNDGILRHGIFQMSNEQRTNENGKDNLSFSAPSLYEVQKWLREVHNLEVSINTFYDKDLTYYFEILNILDKNAYQETFKSYIYELSFNKDKFKSSTYEEALNNGIKEALKLL